MGKLFSIFATALILSTVIAATAEANDRSMRGLMIPASACQLTGTDSATLNVSLGWFVRNGGFAQIMCPLPINHIELGATSTDNDISKFRIHYIDSDALGTASVVKVEFGRYTSVPIGTTVVCRQELAPATVNATSTIVPCAHDVMSGGMFYAFVVTLKAATTNGYAYFLGIDFP